MFRRTIASVMLAFALIVGGVAVNPSPAAASVGCGDTVGDWVPLLAASAWYGEGFINGDPVNFALVLTRAGQLAVTTLTDLSPPVVAQGQYAVIGSGEELDWYAVDLFNTGDRFTYFATATACGPLGAVTTASGPIVQYNVGQVGVFYITRIA